MTHSSSIVPKAELRRFGILSAMIIPLLFGLLIPWVVGAVFPLWPWYCGGVLLVWGIVLPKTLIIVYRPWMALADILAWLNTRIILFLLFYILFVPMGLFMRVTGKDPMQRKKEPGDTYRTATLPRNRNHMENSY